jgi:hypothetical protein
MEAAYPSLFFLSAGALLVCWKATFSKSIGSSAATNLKKYRTTKCIDGEE